MSRVVMQYCVAASLVLLMTGCGGGTFSGPVTLERVGDSQDPAADEEGLFSWREGEHPTTSRPERAPTFTCCETNFRTDRARIISSANANVTLPNGQAASEITVVLEVRLRVRCERQAAAGEGGTGPAADCLLTYREVSATEKPRFSRHPGGALMEPTAQRTWWESATEKCNGRERSKKLRVVYIARFEHQGVPRAVSGEPPSRVVLAFKPKDGQGADFTVAIRLEQLNVDRPLRATIEEP